MDELVDEDIITYHINSEHYLNDFPDEILLKILKYARNPKNTRLVCRRFRRIEENFKVNLPRRINYNTVYKNFPPRVWMTVKYIPKLDPSKYYDHLIINLKDKTTTPKFYKLHDNFKKLILKYHSNNIYISQKDYKYVKIWFSDYDNLIVIASAINFLLILDGVSVLRYTT